MKRLFLLLAFISCSLSVKSQESYFLFSDAEKKYNDGHYDDAIKNYTKAIELNAFPEIKDLEPRDYLVLSYFYRGLAKEKIGDIAGEVADLTKSIALNEVSKAHINMITETKAELYKERGFAKYQLGDYKGSISDFDVALQIKNYNPKLLYYKGLSYEELKNYKEALKCYQSAEFNFREKPSYIYYHLGIVKLKLGQKDNACKDLSKAGELGEADAYKIIQKNCN